MSLSKWANREVRSKAEAGAVLDELRMAIRAGTFDARGLAVPKTGPMRSASSRRVSQAARGPKRLTLAKEYDWSVKPYLERFGNRALVDIRSADLQDFIADLRKPRTIHRRAVRVLSASRVNKIIDLPRHMFNWTVGREYIDHTPFRRGSETLIKKFKEDISDDGGSMSTRKRHCSRTRRGTSRRCSSRRSTPACARGRCCLCVLLTSISNAG
ncbi:MAG TPA: hypothetical protein VMF13_15255 [Luteitalea sp.]|nr:hypothetical protein [Luteitalea sp.]